MKQQWNTSLRLTLGAMAVMGASLAFAQAQPAPETPAATPAAQPAPAHPVKKAHKPVHKPMHKQGSASKYGSPQQHEAAAVAGERRRGGPHNPANVDQVDEYQRNAFKRCEVFKTEDDRRACVERVRQPQISGSVEGGGVIREYTQTVQVPPPPPTSQPAAPGQVVPRTEHLVHPPVQPVR